METRANHLLIGIFVLVLLVGGLGFAAWLARLDVAREFDHYVIYFDESVAGLGVGGDVRFNGIRVGTVKEITFDRQDPSRVHVVVEVTAETPIRSDAYAILQLQGITGVSFVQITGGSATAPMLKATGGQGLPVIPSRPSEITRLVQSAPELLIRGIEVLDRLNAMLGPENEQNLKTILADVARLSHTLAAQAERIDRIVDAADTTAGEVASVAQAIRQLAARLDGLAGRTEQLLARAGDTVGTINGTITADVQPLLHEARQTVASLGRVAEDVQGLLATNQDSMKDFVGDGLAQFSRFITEARQLVAVLSRVSERIENDPSQLLFGQKAPERRLQ